MDANEKRTMANAIAGSLIANALLDALHKKGILSLSEARGVLQSALKQAGTLHTDGVYEAVGLITNKMSGGSFSER